MFSVSHRPKQNESNCMLDKQSYIEAQGKARQAPLHRSKEYSIQRELRRQRLGDEKLHGLPVDTLNSLVWEAWGCTRRCNE